MEENYCVCQEPWRRSIAGHSMGGQGAMDIALRNPDRYRAVAAHAGIHDFQVIMDYWTPQVLTESPETEPPYSYSWGNGFYTNALYLSSAAYSPNLAAEDSIDFPLDENGEIVDSVYALWELHNAAHMVKLMPAPDLEIFFDCGDDDDILGLYTSCNSYSDTLTQLGIDHVFQTLPGVGHGMNVSRFIEELLFLDEAMTGIEGGSGPGSCMILDSPNPNPFTAITSIQFNLPSAGHVTLEIFDISGRLIETVVDGTMVAGNHTCVFDGGSLSP
jgi:hypothetical protein